MAVDYSQSALPKGPTRAAMKAARDALREKMDRSESVKVKARSGGWCEVYVSAIGRCHRRAVDVHHMFGGRGVRAHGESALAVYKQHVCLEHHRMITSHRLVRIGGVVPHWQDRYRKA